jgi:predicted enzyme related to lactoylglutathione lyase
MEKYKSAINWFEIPATDFDRAVRFYSQIYAYELPTRDMGHVRMGFFQHEPGAGTGGAVVAGEGYKPSTNGAKIYLNAGPDLSAVLGRVSAAGGMIVQAKTLISPQIGHYAIIEDSEGNHVYLHSMN